MVAVGLVGWPFVGIQLSLVLPKILPLLFCIVAYGFYQTLLMLLGSDSIL